MFPYRFVLMSTKNTCNISHSAKKQSLSSHKSLTISENDVSSSLKLQSSIDRLSTVVENLQTAFVKLQTRVNLLEMRNGQPSADPLLNSASALSSKHSTLTFPRSQHRALSHRTQLCSDILSPAYNSASSDFNNGFSRTYNDSSSFHDLLHEHSLSPPSLSSSPLSGCMSPYAECPRGRGADRRHTTSETNQSDEFKRWRSTSDFVHNKCAMSAGINTPLHRLPSMDIYKSISHISTPSSKMPTISAGKRAITSPLTSYPGHKYSSMLCLSKNSNAVLGSIRDLASPSGRIVSRLCVKDMSYNSETGQLKVYIKKRPLILYPPSADILTYDVTAPSKQPEEKLITDWVHGYRGKDCRKNLYALPTGEIVYFVAGIAVLHNISMNEQRHYIKHTDDIKCMALHPNRCNIATGQCTGTRPNTMAQVHVWDSISLNTLAVLGADTFQRSVCCLAFSRCDGGSLLACVDEGHQNRVLSVWNWQQTLCTAHMKASNDIIIEVEWNPLEPNKLVTCGKYHLCMWSCQESTSQETAAASQTTQLSYSKRSATFGSLERSKFVTCIVYTASGFLLTGDSTGRLMVWGKDLSCIKRVVNSAHEGSVHLLHICSDGKIISGGGKDYKLIEWSRDSIEPTGNFIQFSHKHGSPRALASTSHNRLVIGTTTNNILSLDSLCSSSASSEIHNLPRDVVIGHAAEIWACDTHPSLHCFATGDLGGWLHVHERTTHSLVWRNCYQSGIQSLAYSPDGLKLVIGFVDGGWVVVTMETHTEEHCVQANTLTGNEAIQSINFNPDGTKVALASRDNHIYLCSVSDWKIYAKCKGHSSFVTHIDWCCDGTYLRSNSGDYELLFWTAADGRQMLDMSVVRDLRWHTCTCVFSFETIGVFPEGVDGTDINAVARSHHERLLASADDFGCVKLFTFPANRPSCQSRCLIGHSSHVTCVRFAHDDSYLISAGGNDTALVIWSVD